MSDQRRGSSRKTSIPKGEDPRDRSSVGDSLTADMLGPGLELVNGKIQLKISPTSPFYCEESGDFNLRTENGVTVAKGSPMSIQARPADSSILVTRQGLKARPNASQVVNDSTIVGDSVAQALENISAATAIPAPFVGAGAGDGVVKDPGGIPTLVKYLRDDGLFAVPTGSGGGFPPQLGFSL